MDELNENDVVALLIDNPDYGLRRGDIGTVVQRLGSTPEHPAGVIVEFVGEDGNVTGEMDITDPTQIVKLRYSPALQAA